MHAQSTATNRKEIRKYVVLARVLLNRLNVHLDQNRLVSESQYGFRKGGGTIGTIQPDNSRRNAKKTKCEPLYKLTSFAAQNI